MSMFIEYAQTSDLAEYLGKDVSELPEGVNFLIKRANEFIGFSMRDNFNKDCEEHVIAAKLAVCAQCNYWIENGVSPDARTDIQSYSLGDLSITYSDVEKFSDKLSPASTRYLHSQGLLYKGMR